MTTWLGQFSSYAIDKHTATEDENAFKECIYQHLDAFDMGKYLTSVSMIIPPASVTCPEAYDYISLYGIDSVPYILQYISDNVHTNRVDEHWMMLVSAYEMLGVQGNMYIHWILHECRPSPLYVYELSDSLLVHINESGLRPIYPFISAEEADVNRDKITRQLEEARYYFGWDLTRDLADYQIDASLVTIFGEYAVPYVLDYILSHEGQSLTPDEEMNLGVLLHLCYRMLGVETTAEWHMPAEAVKSTTDPFPYARELTAHLGEYGLEPVP